jgi:hypothetical protein
MAGAVLVLGLVGAAFCWVAGRTFQYDFPPLHSVPSSSMRTQRHWPMVFVAVPVRPDCLLRTVQ